MLLSAAPVQAMNSIGQTIQIHTNLRSFIGKPTWLLIIRDVDHNQIIPYLYDFSDNDNYWIALTYSRNYLITVSELTMNPYGRKFSNFCNLESMGAVQHGVSMDVYVSGKLSRTPGTYSCKVLKYPEANFNIASPQ
ncbi:MAG TPA: hypothetical protein VL360_05165 [Gammaproteobacteria bacterium]|nr:hypothetical protein [Gammaproteobacteria bacterium]